MVLLALTTDLVLLDLVLLDLFDPEQNVYIKTSLVIISFLIQKLVMGCLCGGGYRQKRLDPTFYQFSGYIVELSESLDEMKKRFSLRFEVGIWWIKE